MGSIDRETLLARLQALSEASARIAARSSDVGAFARQAHVGIGLILAIGEVKDAPEVVEVCSLKPARREESGT